MVDLSPQTEIVDSRGSSVSYVGSVGTIATNIPSSAGNRINSIFVRAPQQTPNSRILSFSIDGGTNYHALAPGEGLCWPLRGTITQIKVKGNVASVNYEVILNFDQSGEV